MMDKGEQRAEDGISFNRITVLRIGNCRIERYGSSGLIFLDMCAHFLCLDIHPSGLLASIRPSTFPCCVYAHSSWQLCSSIDQFYPNSSLAFHHSHVSPSICPASKSPFILDHRLPHRFCPCSENSSHRSRSRSYQSPTQRIQGCTLYEGASLLSPMRLLLENRSGTKYNGC